MRLYAVGLVNCETPPSAKTSVNFVLPKDWMMSLGSALTNGHRHRHELTPQGHYKVQAHVLWWWSTAVWQALRRCPPKTSGGRPLGLGTQPRNHVGQQFGHHKGDLPEVPWQTCRPSISANCFLQIFCQSQKEAKFHPSGRQQRQSHVWEQGCHLILSKMPSCVVWFRRGHPPFLFKVGGLHHAIHAPKTENWSLTNLSVERGEFFECPLQWWDVEAGSRAAWTKMATDKAQLLRLQLIWVPGCFAHDLGARMQLQVHLQPGKCRNQWLHNYTN